MAVFRVHKSKDFTVMSNHHLRNKELSLKAKGLLSLMLSLPEEWDYSVLGLTSLSKDGKDSVMSSLEELRNHGYLTMTMTRDNKGHVGAWDYDVYEKPYSENLSTEKPNAENPYTENPPQYNTDLFSTNSINNESINVDSSPRNINITSDNISTPKESVKKDLDLSFVAFEYMSAFGEWLEYKKKMGKMYKTQRGLKRAYNDLLEACGNNPNFALAVVNDCIDKEYVGICLRQQLKQQLYGNSSSTGAPSRAQQLAADLKRQGFSFT